MRNWNSIGGPDLRFNARVMSFFVLVLMAGCSPKELKWDEDVLLPDGRTVTVHRVQQWLRGEEGQAGAYSLEFVDPDTKQTIRWSHDQNLTTMVLFKSGGNVYLLLRTLWGSSDSIYGCPNPPYFLQRYSNNKWSEVPLTSIPVKRLKVNMTDNIFDRYKIIKQSNLRIGASVTQSRMVQTEKPPYVAPYVMDFSHVQQQTFSLQNCGFGKVDRLYQDQTR